MTAAAPMLRYVGETLPTAPGAELVTLADKFTPAILPLSEAALAVEAALGQFGGDCLGLTVGQISAATTLTSAEIRKAVRLLELAQQAFVGHAAAWLIVDRLKLRRRRLRAESPRPPRKSTIYFPHRQKVLAASHCSYCGDGGKLVIDHVVPTARGGSGRRHNLAAACGRCNSVKGGLLVQEWIATYAVKRLPWPPPPLGDSPGPPLDSEIWAKSVGTHIPAAKLPRQQPTKPPYRHPAPAPALAPAPAPAPASFTVQVTTPKAIAKAIRKGVPAHLLPAVVASLTLEAS